MASPRWFWREHLRDFTMNLYEESQHWEVLRDRGTKSRAGIWPASLSKNQKPFLAEASGMNGLIGLWFSSRFCSECEVLCGRASRRVCASGRSGPGPQGLVVPSVSPTPQGHKSCLEELHSGHPQPRYRFCSWRQLGPVPAEALPER